MLGRVASAIGDAGGTIGSVDLISLEGEHTLRDIAVYIPAEAVREQVVAAVAAVEGAELVDAIDRTFALHVGGKIETRSKAPLRTYEDL